MNSSDFKEQLLEALGEIKGSGSFVSAGSRPFLFPGLEIKGIGEIGFPVNPVEIKEIIKTAHKAPFGKGRETVLDSTVRSAWEINANEITFNNNDWGEFISHIIEQIKPALGIEKHEVSANLYKLLIYEKGDFFLPHKDSEKEKGMFGTLIIGLPAKHTGGELAVKFDGRIETIDFAGPANQYKIPFAAFYADCEHEIKPITSGYRVCLVYNLVQNTDKGKIQVQQFGNYADRLAAILEASEDDKDIPKIILLGHQYTPSNFMMEALKLNDRTKAEALILAAQKAGFYTKLGLVTSFQSGELEMDNSSRSSRSRGRRSYYNGYDDYDDEDMLENGTMGEVYDERIDIEHWMEEGVPPLRNIHIDEENLISAIQLNEGDPIEKEAEGYTGNAGMDIQYWYHYGAVFLWPKKQQYSILAGLNSANKLEWIAWYNQHWDAIEADEKTLIKKLVEGGLNENDSYRSRSDYSPLADWLINLNDEKYFAENGVTFLTDYFSLIAVGSWMKMFETYPGRCFGAIFTTAGGMKQLSIVNHLLFILDELSAGANMYRAFLTEQTDRIPSYVNALELSGNAGHTVAKNILRSVFKLSKPKTGDSVWLRKTTEAFTGTLTREYVNNVLMEVILESGKGLVLAKQIIAICKDDLVQRVHNKPQPPADWSRPLPDKPGDKEIWAILADFLQSPTQQTFDYQRNQNFRTDMENAIRHVTIDLKMETIKKKSPHTLRLTKTQAAYERDMAKWNEDVILLKKADDFGRSS